MSDTQQQDRKAGTDPEAVITPTEDGGAKVTGLPPNVDDAPPARERAAGRDPDDDTGIDDDTRQPRLSDNRRRRERQKARRQESQQQIEDLSNVVMSQQRMLQALTRNQQQQALGTLEREAGDARSAFAEAQRRHSAAVTAGDGPAAAEAMTVMNNATTYYNNVKRQHDGLLAHVRQTPIDDGAGGDQPAPQANGDARPPISRRKAEAINEHREAFLDAHPDLDLESDDPYTVAVKAIDAQVAKEKFDPATKDYWDEVAERIAEAGLTKGGRRVARRQENDDDYVETRRPQRRAARQDDDDERGGPPLGGDGRGPARNGEFTMSPELVKNLEDIGLPLRGGTPDQVKRRNGIIQYWRDNKPQPARR